MNTKENMDKKKEISIEYKAFISYRHLPLSRRIAKKLHGSIEHYSVPKEYRKDVKEKRLGRVFRDEEELAVSDDLSSEIMSALNRSSFLLVICEPGTCESVWVEREIKYFISGHGREHVIAVLADGTPEESFPAILTTIYDEDGNVSGHTEPLAASLTDIEHNYSAGRFYRESFRIYAALLGQPFDNLWQRERRYCFRRNAMIAAFVFSLVFAFTANTWIKNREISLRNERIEQQNIEISSQNAEIQAQYDALDIREGQLLLIDGERMADAGDMRGAVTNALAAVDNENRRSALTNDASLLLSRAVGVGECSNVFRTDVLIDLPADIQDYILSENGQTAVIYDAAGYYRAYDTEDGALLWKHHANGASCCCLIESSGIFIIQDRDGYEAISLTDGVSMWNAMYELENGIYTQPDILGARKVADGQYFLCTGYDAFNDQYYMLYRETKHGQVEKKVILEDEGYFVGTPVMMSDRDGTHAVFSTGADAIYFFDMENEELLNRIDGDGCKRIDCIYDEQGEHFIFLSVDPAESCIYLNEYFLDGSEGFKTKVNTEMPSEKNVSDFRMSVEADGKCIFVSVDKELYIFSGESGDLLLNKKMENADIAEWYMLNDKEYYYIVVDSSGNYYADFGEYGFAKEKIIDRDGFYRLDFSREFAHNDGGYGFYPDENAVAAGLCAGAPRTLFLLHPCIDKSLKTVSWTDEGMQYHASLKQVSGGKLIYSVKAGDGDNAETLIRIIDPETMAVVEEYRNSDTDLAIKLKQAGDMQLWSDNKHITYYSDGLEKYITVDLETGKKTYDDSIWYDGMALINMPDGKTLRFFMDSRDEYDYTAYGRRFGVTAADMSWKKTILMREDDSGDFKYMDLEFDSYKYLEMYGLPAGYLLITVSGIKSTDVQYFRVINIKSREITDIPAVCEHIDKDHICCGSSTALFSAVDHDGYIRIYDIAMGGVRAEIKTEEGEISAMGFDDKDKYLAVVMTDNRLLVYSATDGQLLSESIVDYIDYNSFYTNMDMVLSADESRLYITLNSGGNSGILTCLDTNDWHKVYSSEDVLLYVPETDEVYKAVPSAMQTENGANGIVCFSLPAIDELVERGEEYIEKE